MEGLIVLAIIWFLASRLINAAKGTKPNGSGGKKAVYHPYRTGQENAAPPAAGEPRMEKAEAEAPVYAPGGLDKHPVLQPMVEDTAPLSRPAPSGSIQEETSEGEDPCHDSMEAAYLEENRRSAGQRHPGGQGEEAEGFIYPAIGKNIMVQSVVMSEILTRPCERKRRGFR